MVDMAAVPGWEVGMVGEVVDRTHLEVVQAPEEGTDRPDPKHLLKEEEEEEDRMTAGGKAVEVVRIWSRQCRRPWSWNCLILYLRFRA